MQLNFLRTLLSNRLKLSFGTKDDCGEVLMSLQVPCVVYTATCGLIVHTAHIRADICKYAHISHKHIIPAQFDLTQPYYKLRLHPPIHCTNYPCTFADPHSHSLSLSLYLTPCRSHSSFRKRMRWGTCAPI